MFKFSNSVSFVVFLWPAKNIGFTYPTWFVIIWLTVSIISTVNVSARLSSQWQIWHHTDQTNSSKFNEASKIEMEMQTNHARTIEFSVWFIGTCHPKRNNKNCLTMMAEAKGYMQHEIMCCIPCQLYFFILVWRPERTHHLDSDWYGNGRGYMHLSSLPNCFPWPLQSMNVTAHFECPSMPHQHILLQENVFHGRSPLNNYFFLLSNKIKWI